MVEGLNPTALLKIVGQLDTGSTIFCRNPKPLLCKIIRWGLNSFADHTATMQWIIKDGVRQPYIVEAKGYETSHPKCFYAWLQERQDNTFWVSPASVSAERIKECHGKKYDYMAAVFFMVVFRLTGIWIGPRNKKAQKRYFCFEMSAYIRGLDKWWCKVPQDFPDVHEIKVATT